MDIFLIIESEVFIHFGNILPILKLSAGHSERGSEPSVPIGLFYRRPFENEISLEILSQHLRVPRLLQTGAVQLF